MKSKLLIAVLFVTGGFILLPSGANAQEGEPVVVDEVIAQVNDGVVTLSQVKREMEERADTLKQNGMPEAQGSVEAQKHKCELITTLTKQQLVRSKRKDVA